MVKTWSIIGFSPRLTSIESYLSCKGTILKFYKILQKKEGPSPCGGEDEEEYLSLDEENDKTD